MIQASPTGKKVQEMHEQQLESQELEATEWKEVCGNSGDAELAPEPGQVSGRQCLLLPTTAWDRIFACSAERLKRCWVTCPL